MARDTDTVDEAVAPDQPTELPKQSWPGAEATVKQFSEDKLTTWAAALTYYGILSIFPALLVLVSSLGLDRPVGHAAADRQPHHVAPGPAQDIVTAALEDLQDQPGAAGVLAIVGRARRAVVGVGLHRRVHAAPRTRSRTCPRAGRSGRRPDPPRRHRR